jgi:heparin/heparan-sulfate lyase
MKKPQVTIISIFLICSFMCLPLSAVFLISCTRDVTGKAASFDNMVIQADHPRIWIDSAKICWLKDKCQGKNEEEIQQLAGPSIPGLALTYIITGKELYGRQAIDRALGKPSDPGSIYSDLATPDGENKRNAFLPSLADQAICYDWCYPLLSRKEKEMLRELMIPQISDRIAFRRNWRSFHNAMYSAAWPVTAAMLAIYGDTPYAAEVFDFLKPELEDALKTFDYLFYDGEWPEGTDYNRHASFPAMRIFLALKTATGRDILANSLHFRNTGLFILYPTKPNGLILPNDDNDWPYLGSWERTALLMLNEEYRNGYYQYFLNNCPFERFRLEPSEQYADLLWYDSSIPEKNLTDLPLSRLFRGKGLVIARSGWNWDMADMRADDTWLTFHCGDYFGDHAHYDINSFSIYHKGDMAIDAGRYDPDWDAWDKPELMRQSQFFNYYQRTIAHNTILVKDPEEQFYPGLVNDGGQLRLMQSETGRNVPEDYGQGNFPSDDGIATCDWTTNPGRWETGNITAYMANANFMYVRGDGTKAYSSLKMKSFARQLFFFYPDLVIVMDHVVSSRPEYKKTWLLHSINEPSISSNIFELTYDDGRLIDIPVLPEQVYIEKTGGPGNEFLTDGIPFRCGMESVVNPSELHYGEIPGAWRIELSPKIAATEDYFLNVLMVSDKNSRQVPEVKILSENDSSISIEVCAGSDRIVTIAFNKGDEATAHIIMTEGERIIEDQSMPDGITLINGPD